MTTTTTPSTSTNERKPDNGLSTTKVLLLQSSPTKLILIAFVLSFITQTQFQSVNAAAANYYGVSRRRPTVIHQPRASYRSTPRTSPQRPMIFIPNDQDEDDTKASSYQDQEDDNDDDDDDVNNIYKNTKDKLNEMKKNLERSLGGYRPYTVETIPKLSLIHI